jgi:hypothetical protein
MATVVVTSRTYTLNANDDYVLRWPGQNAAVGRPYTVIISLVDSADDGTYTVKARPQGDTSGTAVAIPYQSLHLNAAVGTGALVSTAITATSLIAIEADGLEIVLTRATGTTGSTALVMALSQMA